MHTKTWNNAVKSAATIILGVTGLVVAPSVKANTANISEQNQTVAVKSNPTVQEFLTTRIYSHNWQNQEAATLHFQNIPLITFLGNDSTETTQRAEKLALRLDQLHQQQVDASEIGVKWNEETEEYTINYGEEELIAINGQTILPDTTKKADADALQATNRLRRLMGDAEPVSTIANKPQPKAVEVVAGTAGVKGSGGRVMRGVASWYGPGFHGRTTANGERFNQNALTAAHRSLPFGTRVRVTNARNGRSVVVRINDRGPFTGGRIIDLAAGAAQSIGLKSSGVGTVTLEVLGR